MVPKLCNNAMHWIRESTGYYEHSRDWRASTNKAVTVCALGSCLEEAGSRDAAWSLSIAG